MKDTDFEGLADLHNVQMLPLQSQLKSQLIQDVGTIRSDYCLPLKPDATPFVIMSRRKLPLPLCNRTQAELREMQQLGAICEIHEQ